MHRANSDNALRHLDFILLDMLIMQLSFQLMYWITDHSGLIYADPAYRIQAIIFFSAQMALILSATLYHHIITRSRLEEFEKMLESILVIWILGGFFILLVQIQVVILHYLVLIQVVILQSLVLILQQEHFLLLVQILLQVLHC